MKFKHSKKYIKKRKRRLSITCALLFVLLSAVCIFGFFIINKNTVITVSVNGMEIGVIEDSEIFALTDTVNDIYSSLNESFGEKYSRQIELSFSEKTVIGSNKEKLQVITAEDGENLVVKYDDRVSFSYSVMLNGKVVADVADTSSAENAFLKAETELKEVISELDSEITEIRSANQINFTRRIAPCEMIIDSEVFYNMLCGETGINHAHPAASQIAESQSTSRSYKDEANIYYTSVLEAVEETDGNEEIEIIPFEAAGSAEPPEVGESETQTKEADGNGSKDVSDEVLAYSESEEEGYSGDEPDSAPVNYYENSDIASLLRFTVIYYEAVYESIDNEVIYDETDERYSGYTFELQKGSCGVRLAEYVVERTGSEEVRTELSSEEIISPQTAVIMVGTREYDEPGTVTGEMIWPIETEGMLVSSLFGDVRGEYDENMGSHLGIDLQGYSGDLVWAADGGIVTYTGYLKTYGNLIIIDHGNGLYTYYAHLSDYAVKEGDAVSRGRVIGYVGATGTVTNYHLHFEIRRGDESVDPLIFLPEIVLHFW